MNPVKYKTAPLKAILRIMLGGPEKRWYGLELAQHLSVRTGTVYPVLSRLTDAGWVSWAWEENETRPGARRKYYTLTEDGLCQAQEIVGNDIICGEESSGLFGDQVYVCQLPRGHQAHRQRGTAWECLCDEAQKMLAEQQQEIERLRGLLNERGVSGAD